MHESSPLPRVLLTTRRPDSETTFPARGSLRQCERARALLPAADARSGDHGPRAEGFGNRIEIYRTPPLAARLRAQARDNLSSALSALDSQDGACDEDGCRIDLLAHITAAVVVAVKSSTTPTENPTTEKPCYGRLVNDICWV